jgi:hypothetical protein
MDVVAATVDSGLVDIEVNLTDGSLKEDPTPIFRIELWAAQHLNPLPLSQQNSPSEGDPHGSTVTFPPSLTTNVFETVAWNPG